MRAALFLLAAACVAASLALLRSPDHGSDPVAGSAAPAPPAAPAEAIADPTRRPAGLSDEPATMADVHAFRDRTARAGAADVADLRRNALSARSPLAAGLALRALGRLRAVAGDAELLALAADPRPRVRQDLMAALGEHGDARALGALASAAADPDPGVRALAIQGLGRIGGAHALIELRALQGRSGRSPVEEVLLRDALRTAAGDRPVFTPGGVPVRHDALPAIGEGTELRDPR